MKILIWIGFLFCVGSFFLAFNSYENFKIDQNGTIVKMEIIKLPISCSGTKINHYATLLYEGQSFVKRIPAGYCDNHRLGEMIEMKYLEGATNILFPNESLWLEFISSILIGLFGLVIAISQLLKSKREK